MNKSILFFIILAFVLCPLRLFAQMDERAPGIYAIMDGESIPLKFTPGVSSVSGENKMGVELSYHSFKYKGVTSETVAGSIFVLVIDPKQKEVIKKLKEYDPFTKRLKPERMLIIPLVVNEEEQCREYSIGMKIEGLRVGEKFGIECECTKISDNSFEIIAYDIVPGEYGFVFNPEGVVGFDYTRIFDFTVK